MFESEKLINQDIIELLAERWLKKEDISDWAIKCLEKGFDSKNLRILASTNNFDSPFKTDDYFNRTLKELGWDKIERTDCLMEYSKILAQRIVEDRVDAIETSKVIYRILIELDYPSELQAWFEIDEMIFDYNHYLKTKSKGHFYRSKEELELEIKRVSEDLLKL